MGANCSADDRRLDGNVDHGARSLGASSLVTLTEDPILLEMGFSSQVSRLYDVIEVLAEDEEVGSLFKVRVRNMLLQERFGSVSRNGKVIAPSPDNNNSNNNKNANSKGATKELSTRTAGSSSSDGLSHRTYLFKQILTNNPVVLLRWFQTIELWQRLEHPNLPRLVDVHEDEHPCGSSKLSNDKTFSSVSFVMEHCEGKPILERSRFYTESQARKILRQILDLIKYLHSRNIVHGDLQAKWFQFEQADPKQWKIQLTDFSMAHPVEPGTGAANTSFLRIMNDDFEVGMYSLAPEVLLSGRPHSPAGDMWSIGIILYQMLSGRQPFGDSAEAFIENMRVGSAPPTFEEPEWKRVSSSAKDLIQKLLNLEPNARLTAEQALKHGWFSSLYRGLSSISYHG
ncbi:MAP kinase-activated protein kinase 2 (Fragment) [Seminavis robusta]|uniref:MAP kinase-activated protein kinase 2 n=1 Tax=Seminavis robusta TaxID=568900 RepID=A0A9N8DLU9_9STRA